MNDRAALLLQGQPRGHVGVMVQASDHDLVARSQRPPDGPADGEGEGRHVLTEHDLVRVPCAEEGSRGDVGLRQ